MKHSVFGIILESVLGCLYGAFVGFCAYLFLHAIVSKLGFGDAYEMNLYILGGTCVPLWGLMKGWIAWENYRLEKAHREYLEFKESQEKPKE